MLQTTTNTMTPELHHSTFGQFITAYISMMENGKILTEKGMIYNESTIRGYTAFSVNFASFEDKYGFRLMTSEINYEIAEKFHIYLVNETQLSKNTIGLVLAKMKAVLAYALRKGFAYWGGEKLKISKEDSTQTYLSTSEISTLKKGELTKSERRVLDIQIIQAFTGLRNKTLEKFLQSPLAYVKEYDGKTYIDITEDKTDKQSVVPLGDIVIDILKNYDGEIKVPSQQYINRKIKIIGMKAGLTGNIVVRKTINGKMTENLVPKHLKLSTHTSRRTLISLMSEFGFEPKEIMPISGHSTEAQMNNYLKLGGVTKVKHLFGNEFFNTSLNE